MSAPAPNDLRSQCASRRWRRSRERAAAADTAAPSAVVVLPDRGAGAQGHEVTLFASGDSQTSAELIPCIAARAAAGRRRSSIRSPTRSWSWRRSPRRRIGSTSSTGISTTSTSRCRDGSACRRSRRSTAGSTSRTSSRSTTSSARCRSSRSRTTSARRCRRRTGWRPSTTACRPTCSSRATSPASTSPSSGASRPRSGPTAPSRSRGAPG